MSCHVDFGEVCSHKQAAPASATPLQIEVTERFWSNQPGARNVGVYCDMVTEISREELVQFKSSILAAEVQGLQWKQASGNGSART